MNSFFRDFKRLAVIGLSRNPKSFSRQAYNLLKANGHELFPVNPNLENIDQDRCYQTIADVPAVEAAVFFTNPQTTLELLPACRDKGITSVWFQPGAANPETMQEAERLGLKAVNSCVFLHHPGSGFPHNVHRFINNLVSPTK